MHHAVGAVNVVATGCAIPLMDTAGRRPLLLVSIAGMLLSLIMVTAALNWPVDEFTPAVSMPMGMGINSSNFNSSSSFNQ